MKYSEFRKLMPSLDYRAEDYQKQIFIALENLFKTVTSFKAIKTEVKEVRNGYSLSKELVVISINGVELSEDLFPIKNVDLSEEIKGLIFDLKMKEKDFCFLMYSLHYLTYLISGRRLSLALNSYSKN